MTKVELIQESADGIEPTFRAVAVGKQGEGRTAGEAIDSLTSQLAHDEVDTLIVVRKLGPDQLFTTTQRQRLEQLMASWRSTRDAGTTLSTKDQEELSRLIDIEALAAATGIGSRP